MADTDEAAIHLPASHDSAPQVETDLSDETQDFRFLSHIIPSDPSQSSLPRRGEKDFEPNPTLHQADVLSASRQAMHNALSVPRLHHPKQRVVGFYAPDGPAPPAFAKEEETKELKEDESKPKKPSTGVHPDSCVYVTNPKGQYFKSMGQADRWNRIWLLPEEALYLLERGSLDIRWSVTDTADEKGQEWGIPMSLQAAYACFLGSAGLDMERYSVYTGLRRLGYTVIRAPGWDGEERDANVQDTGALQQGQGSGLTSVFCRFLQWLYSYSSNSSTGLTTTGPLVGLGIHRSYSKFFIFMTYEHLLTRLDDIYRKLALIPYHDPTTITTSPRTTPHSRIIFHIYKPSTPIRKSAPPSPDFRIAVINARTQPTIPTLSQLGALLESTPLDPPRGEKMDRMLYMRLRHGYRNVILAVVDQGVVSFLRVGDAAFGMEKIYKEKAVQGGKKGRGGFPRPGPRQ